ncbi:MAG: hypothetical protein JAY75_14410 [Candidatus Thiodiazotropha taylori]|nr:hypothetical protein [Candidatus Thiodiazotropha taylori]MCW4263401.1 hypothetical protein [Candidatus Thiodiazotropha endolucinida]MCG8044855.1 hypothetical protein [Candidatus Thiodiazotropha taylori]MCG8077418.1 hypothetical protein [Candidatus Thiodiazotropha taylori]MCG8116728.1 hypothetical protein [Candidatus Thiodiazotropha taylori]
MREVQEVECFDVEIFLAAVPEDLECKEELLVEILADLAVLGTKICLATEVLLEQFCIETDVFCSAHSVSDEMEGKHKRECDSSSSLEHLLLGLFRLVSVTRIEEVCD